MSRYIYIFSCHFVVSVSLPDVNEKNGAVLFSNQEHINWKNETTRALLRILEQPNSELAGTSKQERGGGASLVQMAPSLLLYFSCFKHCVLSL